MSGTVPSLFLTLMGLGFMALPGVILVGAFRHRQRLRNWTPCEATLDELETKTSHSNGDSDTRVIGHYRYRAPDGSEHTGSGKLPDGRVGFDDQERRIEIVVDPMDPSRSLVNKPQANIGCLVVFCLPFLAAGLLVFTFGVGLLLGG